MAASPCGGRRPPCRRQSDAGHPSRHRPGEGRPSTSALRPAPGGGTLCPSPVSAGSSRAPAAPPRLRWLQNDGKAARPAVHRRDTHARPPCHTVTPSRGAGPPVSAAWPGGWRGVGRARLLTGPGKAAGRAPGQRTSPEPPAAGGWTPLSKPASDLRGEASQRLRSQHTGAGRAFGVVLTRKLLTNFIYIH